MHLEEECKKNIISHGHLANFSSLNSRNLFPAIPELVCISDVLCLLTRPKFLQKSVSRERELPLHQSVPHLQLGVVNLLLVFGL